jgi:hypothetical protein
MGRLARSWRAGTAVVLTAACLTVPASARQAPVPGAPAAPLSTRAPQQDASTPQTAPEPEPTPNLPFPSSVERVKEALQRPVLRLDMPPVFYVEIEEQAPESIELSEQFEIAFEPRGASTPWQDQYMAMTTPPEFRLYSPMLTPTERAVIAATSFAFAGAMALLREAIENAAEARRREREAEAREEVNEALRRFEAEQERPQ